MTVGSAAWRHRMYQRTYYRMPGWLGRWRERRHARYDSLVEAQEFIRARRREKGYES